jgi:hypothetical protein
MHQRLSPEFGKNSYTDGALNHLRKSFIFCKDAYSASQVYARK